MTFHNFLLATGSTPLPGAPLAAQESSSIQILSTWELMDLGPRDSHVVLFDEGGGRGGLSAIDAVLEENRVTIISSDFAVGELVNPNIRTPLHKRFLSNRVEFRPAETLLRLDTGHVVTRNIYSGEEHRIDNVDILVDWRGNSVRNELQRTLEARSTPVIAIGDCVAPRHLHTAIAEGAMAAREL